jgi:hypothetical protein
MALLHRATITPSKLELLQAWLPSRPWCTAADRLRQIGAYRFDDPSGEVGIETFVLHTKHAVLHVPLTYRAAPMEGADRFLVGTGEHSVLGQRWVYDGCGDPVWAQALARAVLTGGTQAEEAFMLDGYRKVRWPTVTVAGSGRRGSAVPVISRVEVTDEDDRTVVVGGGLRIEVARIVGATLEGTERLTGHWADAAPAVLAAVRPNK